MTRRAQMLFLITFCLVWGGAIYAAIIIFEKGL